MHKIDAAGANGSNEFTEGNPALSIPATVVDANWLNAIQRELAGVVTGAGITLAASGGADSGTQVIAAIQALIAAGGATTNPVSMTPSNNQTAPANITGMPVFLTTQVIQVTFRYQVVRHTSVEDLIQGGNVTAMWNPNTSAWTLTRTATGDTEEDDALDVINFSIITTGNANEYKFQYTTSNMLGTSYSATLRINDIKKIPV